MTTEEKSIVVYTQGELAEWAGDEWADDGTSDIAPSFPVVKIVQATSSMEGSGKHAGDFWRSDTETYVSHFKCVPLFKKNTRALFAPGNDQPLCASSDAIAPRPGMPLWATTAPAMPEAWLAPMEGIPPGQQPASCDACPFSQWEGDNPPPCKASINLLVDDDGDLVQLRISGKSLKPFRQFVARKLAPKKLPLCSQRLDLYTEERTEPGKKWYELRIDTTALTPAEARPYNVILRDERARFESSLAIEPDDEGPKDVTPQWEDGSRSFRERVDPETGEVLDSNASALHTSTLTAKRELLRRPDDALEQATFGGQAT